MPFVALIADGLHEFEAFTAGRKTAVVGIGNKNCILGVFRK